MRASCGCLARPHAFLAKQERYSSTTTNCFAPLSSDPLLPKLCTLRLDPLLKTCCSDLLALVSLLIDCVHRFSKTARPSSSPLPPHPRLL
ncbi:RHTO0S20e00188g1_1 [Rhodotorula toruloides]|uniref:RHTO0S20e00188g1_1 n=2 Tax=Rhodotorula toruloides TaxID=5286 RepID=A0A061BL86_RHOTO|nr:uncharacterized protein RHTO_04253 [Rhodotorula toruloides NP11]EMS19479.1 hypothetical protein RHTO_04253 [Rhodotorula toruloides NP11]CDR48733.1 RHTO0S20e00188g1_1 [Rhodotorula toruloides]